MSQTMSVNLYSPAKPLAEVSATYLQIPGILGYMGIMPGHTALISELGIGELRIEGGDAGKGHTYFVSGGYLEVLDNNIKVLVDSVEHCDDIDVGRAKEAEERAIKRLAEKSDLDLDIARALAALERAKARQKLVQQKQ
jgi:F-type H+-transporting ATPase subunit epsilon